MVAPELSKLPLPEWNKGIFAVELLDQALFPRASKDIVKKGDRQLILPPKAGIPPALSTGTFDGTQRAVTEIFHRIIQRFGSYFDVANFESTIPQPLDAQAKQQLFTFQAAGSDKFPPHLHLIPPQYQTKLTDIFDSMRLLDTGTLLTRIIPENIEDFIHGDPIRDSIAGIEARNRTLRAKKKDVFADPNIGDRPDWYSDAVFAQQQFTGPNPTTIIRASSTWIDQFKGAASAQGNRSMYNLLSTAEADSLYVQDYSYFRAAVGAAPDAPMVSGTGSQKRYACAAVSLFQLSASGKLHPLAVVLDYRKTMETSVVMFNRRLRASDPTTNEATDWPWRYAKMCAQISDWTRHEVEVHLVNTHLVEEAVIVAAHRTLPAEHAVFRLLQPHWLKTLSLNAAARSSLVPEVIVNLVGFTDTQLYAFMNHAYETFDWTGLYVPVDLAHRGFPPDKLLSDRRYHNYCYGRDMVLMWNVLRQFVAAVLAAVYENDAAVAADPAIAAWVAEMHSPAGANLKSFPNIQTLHDLIDAVVMCIHIAAPQHTAVNYLQQYYQSFVISKPPALCAPMPASLGDLLKYKESDLMKALPIDRPREWLMASHLPNLLSMRVAEDQNLMNYAASLANLAAQKGDTAVASAATKLYGQLVQLVEVFNQNSKDMDDQTTPYDVMNPDYTAVSILI